MCTCIFYLNLADIPSNLFYIFHWEQRQGVGWGWGLLKVKNPLISAMKVICWWWSLKLVKITKKPPTTCRSFKSFQQKKLDYTSDINNKGYNLKIQNACLISLATSYH